MSPSEKDQCFPDTVLYGNAGKETALAAAAVISEKIKNTGEAIENFIPNQTNVGRRKFINKRLVRPVLLNECEWWWKSSPSKNTMQVHPAILYSYITS